MSCRFLMLLGVALSALAFINMLHDIQLGEQHWAGGILLISGMSLFTWAWISLSDLKMRAVSEEMLERIRRQKAADAAFVEWGERIDIVRGTRAAEGPARRLDSQCK